MSVLVTAIGGNVGQGVLRIIRSMNQGTRLIGTDMLLPCGGTHLSDATYSVPHAMSERYIDTIRGICEAERVELILPCTDIEAYILACHPDLPALTSPPATQLAFLDKHLTGRVCADAGIPFARTCLPNSRDWLDYGQVVVKEREGRGSRGIHYDADPRDFGDDFVVQERLVGPEITVGFYTNQRGHVCGFLALERELGHGATMRATVTHKYDRELDLLVQRVSKIFGVRGSCNVQAIVTERGPVPFEINGRISGSASIRDSFGFVDVVYAVCEYVLKIPFPPLILGEGTATRLLMDVIYPDANPDEARDIRSPHMVT